MAERKSFLVRIDAQLLEQLRRWADDEMRSVNGQIEYVLRKALTDSGRGKKANALEEENQEGTT